MAKVKRLMPKASSGATDAAKMLAASMNKGQEITLDNALVLASEKKLGHPIPNDDIINIARRTTDPNVATRLFTQFSKTTEASSYQTLMRLSIGLAQVYGQQANLIIPTVPRTKMIAQTLAAFFVNRVCDSNDNSLRMLVEVDAPASLKLASMFDSFWASMDIEKLRNQTFESESATPVTFRKVKLDGVSAYTVHKAGKHCGHLFWDTEIPEPSDSSHGWRATLFDGYATASYSEGPCSNPHDPYVKLSKGELKLHNPQRLSLADVKSWTRRALK